LSEKFDKEHMNQYLKEMIKEKPKNEPVEQVLTTFCQRYGVSMGECRVHYDELVKKGEIKEK
jgi:hypothetical protein